MNHRVLRILLPVCVLLAGLAAIVHGTSRRLVPVHAEVMVEKEEVILERPTTPWHAPGQPGPALPPRPKRVTRQVPQEQILSTGEPRIIRDVTVGGLTRLKDGTIRLTYRAGEDGPALCPT